MRRLLLGTTLLLALLLTIGCSETTKRTSAPEKTAKKAKPKPKAPERDPGILPVWAEPMPATWTAMNTFDGNVLPDDQKDKRRNDLEACFTTWGYENGECTISQEKDGDRQVLAMTYSLPNSKKSETGYSEYFKGVCGDPKPFDLSDYEKIGFVARVKKGEGEQEAGIVTAQLMLVEYDKYEYTFKQGLKSRSRKFEIDGEWRRYEFSLQDMVRGKWNMALTRSLSFRIDVQDGNGPSGTVLLDNLVLIKPDAKEDSAK